MLGSILSNCLLVLGMCFFAGGVRFHEQSYGVRLAQQQISLLLLSVFSIVVPAAFSISVDILDANDILNISRATAIILLVCYMASLFFQLWTHSYLYCYSLFTFWDLWRFLTLFPLF
jgi:Ca2+:H+ antiporter